MKTIPCLASALALMLAGCGQSAAANTGKSSPRTGDPSHVQPVEVVNIQRSDLVETLNLVGSILANETAQIRAEIAGQIRAVLFDEGQRVEQGQVILRIDDSELRAQLAQAEARLALAAQNLKRTQGLTSQQFISEAEVDQTRADHAAAAAEVEYLRVRLAKMQIKAPFDGIAGARTVSPGDFVDVSMTATPITTIDDLSRLKIEFQVPEIYASRVEPGTRFKVRARTPNGESLADGHVYFASAVIDRDTRSLQVKGYIDGALAGFRPGMFANIELELDIRKNVLAVPEGAILVTTSRGTQIVVAREHDGDFHADFVNIETGMRTRGLVEVTPTLDAGKTIDEKSLVIASGVGALILYQDGKLEPRALRKEFALESEN